MCGPVVLAVATLVGVWLVFPTNLLNDSRRREHEVLVGQFC